MLAELAQRGLHRVLCEGGPTLLGDIVAQNILDELALTISPMLVAGTALRVVEWQSTVSAPLRSAHLMTDEDGYLYLRYTRAT